MWVFKNMQVGTYLFALYMPFRMCLIITKRFHTQVDYKKVLFNHKIKRL